MPQILAPQSSGTTVATGHCLVQTVHSAGFVQPGSQPIGRSSSATGQTFEQVEHDGSDVVLFIFAGSQKSVRVVCVKKFAFVATRRVATVRVVVVAVDLRRAVRAGGVRPAVDAAVVAADREAVAVGRDTRVA